MPFARQLSDQPSHSQIRVPRQVDLRAVSDRPFNSDRALLPLSKQYSLSRQDPPRPAILAAVPSLMVKAVARFTVNAGIGFPGLLLAIISWTVTEFLAGCAAYAEAMYPAPVIPENHVHFGDPVSSESSSLPLKAKPYLTVIAGNRDRLLRLEQAGQGAEARAERECALQPKQLPAEALSPRHGLIVAPAISLLWNFRRALVTRQKRRQAVMELRGLDDRTLRDIGISRSDVEHIASHEDWRE